MISFDGITVEVEVIKRYGSAVIGLCQDRIIAFNTLVSNVRPLTLTDCWRAVDRLGVDVDI